MKMGSWARLHGRSYTWSLTFLAQAYACFTQYLLQTRDPLTMMEYIDHLLRKISAQPTNQ